MLRSAANAELHCIATHPLPGSDVTLHSSALAAHEVDTSARVWPSGALSAMYSGQVSDT